MLKILIRGSGDIGSAAAWKLFHSGYYVVLHDDPQPAVTRRKMAFSEAAFDGSAWLESIEARRIDDPANLQNTLPGQSFIPLLVCDFNLLLSYLLPDVLVDARMRKHSQPESQIGLAALTIGLGPNFDAGRNVHLAIETGRGPDLGKVIESGSTRPLQGEPVDLGGHARERYIYAPAAGRFETNCQIGESVSQGQVIAHLDGRPLLAPLTGVLRGLIRSGVAVQARAKIIEIDPRGAEAQVTGIAARPARIAEGVLKAIRNNLHWNPAENSAPALF